MAYLGKGLLITLSLALLSGTVACGKQGQKPSRLEQTEARFAQLAENKEMRELAEGYLGIKRLPMDDEHAPLLQTPVTLRTHASLSDLCDTLMRLVPVQVHLVREDTSKPKPKPAQNPADPELMRLLGEEEAASEQALLAINHEGPFVQLLESIAAASGYGWDYDRKSNTLTFARNMVKTFYLRCAPGKVGYAASLSNQSLNEEQGGDLGQPSAQSRKTSQSRFANSQNYQASLAFDVFADTVRTIKSMLTPQGQVQSHEAAGSITVCDHPENLRRITRYMQQLNDSLSRQVAMKVNVYALETSDDTSLGLDLALLLPSLGAGTVSLAAGSQALGGLSGAAQATILDGSLKGSSAVLTALKKLGRARQITSAGIVAMNNQPAPVEAIQKTSYLAGSSIESTEHGSERALIPGEVTTGFSMTITPYILPERKVVLQYTVQLSSLDGLEAFESSHASIQLPRVSSRAFSQKATLLMGQTLVLAGFEQAGQQNKAGLGLLKLGQESTQSRSLIIVTIEVENAAPDIAQQAFKTGPRSAAFWPSLSGGLLLAGA
ncbi:MAG: hypothetical protein K6G15_03545 [Desulfovibrio sp.]|nr:hypothetical protein [Desulfovibrio sp.]